MAIDPHRYALRDGAAPVGRADEGIFGSYSAEIGPGRWLTCPPESCPALNLHGPSAQVSVVAWIKPRRQDPPWCEFIAGLWDERAMHRQYGLFLGLGLTDVKSPQAPSPSGQFRFPTFASAIRASIPRPPWATPLPDSSADSRFFPAP